MALYGIYGKHTTEACPWNNIETAKRLLTLVEERDLGTLTAQFKIKPSWVSITQPWNIHFYGLLKPKTPI